MDDFDSKYAPLSLYDELYDENQMLKERIVELSDHIIGLENRYNVAITLAAIAENKLYKIKSVIFNKHED